MHLYEADEVLHLRDALICDEFQQAFCQDGRQDELDDFSRIFVNWGQVNAVWNFAAES